MRSQVSCRCATPQSSVVRVGAPFLNSSERLSQDHIEQAQLSDKQRRQIYARFGQKVLPSQYPTADEPTVTAAEQDNFIQAIVVYHRSTSKPQIPMEYGSLISTDLPTKLDQNKKFHLADDDLKSAYLVRIEDHEKDYDKKRRKAMAMPQLTTKNKLKDIVKRAKLYGKELEMVKYGESILVKRVVQFEDGIIRMECAGQHLGKWVTLTKDTALEKVSGHLQDSNRTGVLHLPGGKDRQRNFIVNQYPPSDEETTYFLNQDCEAHADDGMGLEMQPEGSVKLDKALGDAASAVTDAAKDAAQKARGSPGKDAGDKSMEAMDDHERVRMEKERELNGRENKQFKAVGVATNRWGLTRLQTAADCWVDFLDKDTGMPVIRHENSEETAEKRRQADEKRRVAEEKQRLEEEKAEKRRQEEQAEKDEEFRMQEKQRERDEKRKAAKEKEAREDQEWAEEQAREEAKQLEKQKARERQRTEAAEEQGDDPERQLEDRSEPEPEPQPQPQPQQDKLEGTMSTAGRMSPNLSQQQSFSPDVERLVLVCDTCAIRTSSYCRRKPQSTDFAETS